LRRLGSTNLTANRRRVSQTHTRPWSGAHVGAGFGVGAHRARPRQRQARAELGELSLRLGRQPGVQRHARVHHPAAAQLG
jgi:hypothetical protein